MTNWATNQRNQFNNPTS